MKLNESKNQELAAGVDKNLMIIKFWRPHNKI
jgi:hypothetical protein